MTQMSRRGFLQTAAAATSVLAVGFTAKGALAQGAAPQMISPFVKVYPDGTVAAIIKHFEGGQGVATGLSALVAEEMNMDLTAITFEMAPANNDLYKNLAFGMQGTGGSTAMANSFVQYRTAAAATREVLIQAAAQAWGLDAAAVTLEDSVLTGGGNSASIGDFVEAAAGLDLPAEPALKTPDTWRVIGKEQRARRDTAAKINGSAQFSMDVQLDNQMVVAIKRSPRLGGAVASFDDSAAKAVPGFIMAVAMPNGKGVMAYAETTWAAFQARDALDVVWDDSAAETRSTADLKAELMAMVEDAPQYQATPVGLADAEAALQAAETVVEQTFYLPMLAHGPMEAMGATLEPTADGGVIVHDGAQFPAAALGVMPAVLGIEASQVQVNTLYAGGFFGRRATPDADYLVELAMAFAVTDRTRPVKLQWSREDDITGGYYRPAYAHRIRAGMDADGKIVAWDHRVAGQSIFKGTSFESFVVHNDVDHTSIEGLGDTPYGLGALHVGLTDQKGPTMPNWWRSVGHSHTAYAMECMMDLCAKAVGTDPVAFRLAHLQGEGADQARLRGVIEQAAEKADWGSDVPAGKGRGFAVWKSFGSYVAQVCDVSLDGDGFVKIDKFTASVDCGIAVTPDVVRAQIEGGIGYGVGHIMRAEVTLDAGVPEQSNFHDYETLRIWDIGAIETHIVPSTEAPTGVGEPGTPPAGPALANAIAAAGKDLVTTLPMALNGVDFA